MTLHSNEASLCSPLLTQTVCFNQSHLEKIMISYGFKAKVRGHNGGEQWYLREVDILRIADQAK